MKFFSTLLHSLKVSKKEPGGVLYLILDILLSIAYVFGILSESLPLRPRSRKQ